MKIFELKCNYSLIKFLKKVNASNKNVIRYQHSPSGNGHQFFSIGEHVAAAKEQNLPIVALESAIITHGMPYPDNLETALSVENAIKEKVIKIQ